MDDTDDGCQTASKRHKSEDSVEEELKENKNEPTDVTLKDLSPTCVLVGNDAAENGNVCASMMATSLPSSSTNLLTGDSGLDVGFNANVAENFLTSGSYFSKTPDRDEDILSPKNTDKNNKLDITDSGLVTDGSCTSTAAAVTKSNEVENASNMTHLSVNKNEKETVTSFKRNENGAKDNLKVRIYRNRLSFLSSSSSDGDGDADETEPQRDKDSLLHSNATDVKNVEENENKLTEMPTSSINSMIPPDITQAAEAGPSGSTENTETNTTTSAEAQQRRRRGNRSARRNYRNRLVFSTPSSSAEEEEEEPIRDGVVNSSNENLESRSDAENVSSGSYSPVFFFDLYFSNFVYYLKQLSLITIFFLPIGC